MLRAALMLQATKTCHLLAVIVCVSVGMYEFVCHASLCVCVCLHYCVHCLMLCLWHSFLSLSFSLRYPGWAFVLCHHSKNLV